MSKPVLVSALVVALALLAGCAQPAPTPSATPPADAAASCRDDGPRLPDTGICLVNVEAYLPPVDGPAPLVQPGCAWGVNEALIADGSEALLYRALTCGDVATKLAYGGGAKSATFAFAQSPLYGEAGVGQTLIQIFPIPEGQDGKAMLLAMARATTEDQAEAAACEVVTAGFAGWPADALIVTPNAAYKAKHKQRFEEVYTACGPWGVDVGSSTYWRIKQGYAWRYTLGQEETGIDPISATLVRKGADGAWTVQD